MTSASFHDQVLSEVLVLGICRSKRHLSSLHVGCRMAFPVPSHLRKKQPTDVSSAILGRISDADSKSLSSALAETWITDLDESIGAAKVGFSVNLCPS
jgi:hypothetical protein